MYKVKRFFDCQVPVNLCNFECDYCTVGQWRAVQGPGPEKYTLFKYPVEQMAAALSPKRWGGVCAINLCGNGETLLHPQILEFTELLLKDGHFVSIVTNGTVTKAIDYLCGLEEEMRSRIFIKFSFHYTELLKKNLLDVYFNNVDRAHKAGMSLTVELVASDGNVPYIDEIKNVCMQKMGVLCHLTDPRANTTKDIRHLTEMPMDEHLRIWSQFDSALFDYRQATWGQNRKDHFCYGGVWSFNLGLGNGRLKQCYRDADTVQFIFDDVEEPIRFLPRGHFCSFAHCFNSHVFDCLCGVIPEIDSPAYMELRNRILPDGTEWLKQPYKDIYGNKICENNEKYSKEEKIYADGIMRLSHGENPSQEFSELVEKYLNSFKKRALGVYGENAIANWLCSKPGLKKWNAGDRVDLLVITDFSNFVQIKTDLKNEGVTSISIMDLPSEAKKYECACVD